MFRDIFMECFIKRFNELIRPDPTLSEPYPSDPFAMPYSSSQALRISNGPLLLLAAWIMLIGGIQWMKAGQSRLPPIGDDYSYIGKAMNTWANIRKGLPQNPFDVSPALRPPGTVLVTYPFGFDTDYRAFRFRTVFIPFAVWTSAVLLLCWPRSSDRASKPRWLAAWAAIVFGANPFFFAFEIGPTEVHWGLLDQALGAFAGLSLALLVRAMAVRSTAMLAAGVASAAFCLALKPSGSLVLLLTCVYFIVGEALRLWDARRQVRPEGLRFLLIGLFWYAVLGGGLSVVSLTSGYLSPEEMAINRSSQAIVMQLDAKRSAMDLLRQHYIYIGLPGLLLLTLALAAVVRDDVRGALRKGSFNLWSALLITLFGYLACKYLMGMTTIRYFSAFAFPALAALLAWLVGRPVAGRPPGWLAGGVGLLVAANTAGVAAHPDPSPAWEAVSGVNTSTRRPLDMELRMGQWMHRAFGSLEREPIVYIHHSASEWIEALSSNVRNYLGDTSKGYSVMVHNIWRHESVIDLRRMFLKADLILSKAGWAKPHFTLPEFKPISDFIWREAQAGRIRTIHRMEDMVLVQIPDKAAFLAAFNEAHVGHRWSDAFMRKNRVADGRISILDTLTEEMPFPEGGPAPWAGKSTLDATNAWTGGGDTLRSGEILALQGWLVVDREKGLVPDEVYVTLQTPGRPIRFGRAEREPRPDLAHYFRRPSLRDAGFNAILNMWGVGPEAVLGLAYVRDGRWHRVPGFRRTLVVESGKELFNEFPKGVASVADTAAAGLHHLPPGQGGQMGPERSKAPGADRGADARVRVGRNNHPAGGEASGSETLTP